MKKIVSVSIGSSERDKKVEVDIMGEHFVVERIGTNGSIKDAIELIRQLDGKVDAFGMGGIDLYLPGAHKNFMIREAVKIKNAARTTPIVDGTFVKNTLEGEVVKYIHNSRIVSLKGKKVLIVCAIDRYKMALEFAEQGCDITMGDLIFALGIPIPIKSIKAFRRMADTLLPVISLLPFKFLYPTGDKQNKKCRSTKYRKYYDEADIIAGDFHYIKKYMPEDMTGKTIVTNTVTEQDIKMLKDSGVSILVTTTPEFDGRSFGTNVIEAILVSASGKRPEELKEKDFFELIEKVNLKPRVEYLNGLTETAGL